ncbi:MAG: hypothetical protein ACO3ZY_03630 [Phycisphaerales bacterium]
MRAFWIAVLLLTAIAAAWTFWPQTPADRTTQGDPVAVRSPAPVEPTIQAETPEPEVREAPEVEPAEAAQASEAAEPLPLGLEASIPEATIVAGSILQGPKGVLLADDRFEIEGEGTRENPYRVSWELLVSAGENYRPRVGDRGIPQRIAMLDGKWVAIDGYVAFPMLVGTTSEALVMLNRWDGCCIGVPPSPYDAIEVKLDRPVVRTQMHAIDYGAVVGVLEVEPYLVDDWLVGLYLMDDATLKLDL